VTAFSALPIVRPFVIMQHECLLDPQNDSKRREDCGDDDE
jgi:hypothetical protein